MAKRSTGIALFVRFAALARERLHAKDATLRKGYMRQLVALRAALDGTAR